MRLGSLDWKPETERERVTESGTTVVDARGIAGLQLAELDRENHYCLSLKIFGLEKQFHPFTNESRIDAEAGSVEIGCMWTSVFAGAEFVMLQLMAATSPMSRIVSGSNSVARLWYNFAESAHALRGYVDLETDTAKQLYPVSCDLLLPSDYAFHFCDDEDAQFSIDDFARLVDNKNGG